MAVTEASELVSTSEVSADETDEAVEHPTVTKTSLLCAEEAEIAWETEVPKVGSTAAALEDEAAAAVVHETVTWVPLGISL
tara:strand:- start:5159 stop:5401 length:243 start_codon:yes stop_codon:yes gene_type:complete